MPKIPNDFIYDLIAKKLSGQISNADIEALNYWINSSKEVKECFEELKIQWNNIQFSNEINKSVLQKDTRDLIWEKVF